MTSRSTRHALWMSAAAVLAAAVAVLVLQLTGGHRASPGVALSAPASAPGRGFDQVVDRALPSVVQIRTSVGLGSGVVYDRDGHVVTNAHVVAGSKAFRVTLADGSRHSATLRGVYRPGDLAVIRLDGARPEPATFADSSQVRVGEYALAIGNPLGLRSSVTQGVISSTSRTVGEGNGVVLASAIQTSAPINPGNSGGALVDATGAVIGIPTLAALDPELGGPADGIGFAISSNAVRSVASQLVAHGHVGPSGRAWLGVDLRGVHGMGAVVASTVASGPAARAGLRPGDVIVRAAGHPVLSADDLVAALANETPGRRIAIDFDGPRGPSRAHVTLAETPAMAAGRR
jgi:putative serine protease PepD